jgi:hypothetical protein
VRDFPDMAHTLFSFSVVVVCGFIAVQIVSIGLAVLRAIKQGHERRQRLKSMTCLEMNTMFDEGCPNECEYKWGPYCNRKRNDPPPKIWQKRLKQDVGKD